jgi:hypothetical protein
MPAGIVPSGSPSVFLNDSFTSIRLIEHQIKRKVKTFRTSSLENSKGEDHETVIIHPSALAGAIETSLRQARHSSRQARLRRELARLPNYVA